jgi:hypothetical protein
VNINESALTAEAVLAMDEVEFAALISALVDGASNERGLDTANLLKVAAQLIEAYKLATTAGQIIFARVVQLWDAIKTREVSDEALAALRVELQAMIATIEAES